MNLAKLIIAGASFIAGGTALKEAFKREEEDDLGRSNEWDRLPDLGKTQGRPPTAQVVRVRTIDQRVQYCIRQAIKGRRDPRIRALAVKIVSQKCGSRWCVGERDYQGELRAIFKYVRANVRYVRDPVDRDTFQHPMRTLEWGGEDCFPEGTLLLKAPGIFVPVESIAVGDTIYDGKSWTRVTNHWHKGILPVLNIQLNNGSALRVTSDHRCFMVPRIPNGNRTGLPGSEIEIKAGELEEGDDLLQPTTPVPFGSVHLSEHQATICGAFLAEGWVWDHKSIGIAGIPNGKGLRERVITAATALGLSFHTDEKQIRLGKAALEMVQGWGTRATNKQLPHLNFDEPTIRTILSAMEQGDAHQRDRSGSGAGKELVYSTISPVLALQYRMMQRMLGRSCSVTRVDEHGGLGSYPIYRVQVRLNSDGSGVNRRPWARIRSIEEERIHQPVYDLETESKRIYLPESDTIVHNCDGYAVVLAALLGAIGYECKFRVVQTIYGKDFDHIYLIVGLPPTGVKWWVPLDASVDKPAFWEAPRHLIKRVRDFPIPMAA